MRTKLRKWIARLLLGFGTAFVLLAAALSWLSFARHPLPRSQAPQTRPAAPAWWEDLKDQKVYLDLGRVKDLAAVRVNGKRLGVVWCAPWRIELTGAVRPGSNDVELAVANQWVNRLIGDFALPQERRFTWTTWNPYKPILPLLESGLLGPVTLSVTVSEAEK